jgi:hypothetical protein
MTAMFWPEHSVGLAPQGWPSVTDRLLVDLTRSHTNQGFSATVIPGGRQMPSTVQPSHVATQSPVCTLQNAPSSHWFSFGLQASCSSRQTAMPLQSTPSSHARSDPRQPAATQEAASEGSFREHRRDPGPCDDEVRAVLNLGSDRDRWAARTLR